MTNGLRRLRERFDAILFDLDGTLLDGQAALTPRTTQAIGALVEAGFLVLLCTGRSVQGTRRHHAALGLTGPIIAYNGAWIGHPGAAPWRYAPIPDALVEWVERTEGRAHFSFRHQGEWKYTLTSRHGQHERVANWYENVVRVPERSALPCADLMRVSCYFDADLHPDQAWDALPEDIRGRLHRETFPLSIFPSFEGSDMLLLELQGRGRGKAEAFEWLESERGIPASRTIAVGDHVNDLPMIEAAGLSVAMANAVAPVKAAADLVIGHHAEEAVARWVEAGAPTAP